MDTASGSRFEDGHELSVKGMIGAGAFKKDVWAMKRGEPIPGIEGVVAPVTANMLRDVSSAGGGGMGGSSDAKLDAQTALLVDILAVLKEQNHILLKQARTRSWWAEPCWRLRAWPRALEGERSSDRIAHPRPTRGPLRTKWLASLAESGCGHSGRVPLCC